MIAANADDADDKISVLITSASQLVTWIDNIDTAGSGDEDSDSDMPL